MRQLLFPLLLLLVLSRAHAQQVPDVEWHAMYGGMAEDNLGCFLPLDSGNFLLAGSSMSNNGIASGNHFPGRTDAMLFKTTAAGQITWHRMYGGTQWEGAGHIVRCANGGAIFIGTTNSVDGDISGSFHGVADVWVVRIDDEGEILWDRLYGGPWNDSGMAIGETHDGGFLFIGSIGSTSEGGDIDPGMGGYWLVKLDSTGEILWQSRFGGSSWDLPYSMHLTADGGCIIAGYTWSDDGDVTGYHPGLSGDGWVVKVDASGQLQWQKALGGSGNDLLSDMAVMADGSYVVTGYTNSNDGDVSFNHGGIDAWVVKLDPTGNIVWEHTLGGTGTDHLNSVVATDEGGLVLAGYTNSLDGDVSQHIGGFDGWVVNLDSLGNLLWELSMGGSADDSFSRIVKAPDGGLLIGGISKSNDGHATGNQGLQDIWVVKLGPEVVGMLEQAVRIPITVYPNPATDLVQVEYPGAASGEVCLEVLDAAGRPVLSPACQGARPGGQQWVLDASPLPPGAYLLCVRSTEGAAVRSLIRTQ